MIATNSMVRLSDFHVTIGHAADMLLVNRTTVRRWIKEGKLRGERLGTTTLILKEDVRHIGSGRGIVLRD
jgi:excisionase family DNA binding protein